MVKGLFMNNINMGVNMKIFSVLIAVVLLIGCGGSFKSVCDIKQNKLAEKEQVVAEKEISGEVIRVTQKNDFNNYINGDLPVIAKFSAPATCPPCRMMEPLDKQMAKKFSGKIRILEIDVYEAGELASSYGIQGVPTYIYFKKGKELKKKVGASSVADYENMIKKIFELK